MNRKFYPEKIVGKDVEYVKMHEEIELTDDDIAQLLSKRLICVSQLRDDNGNIIQETHIIRFPRRD